MLSDNRLSQMVDVYLAEQRKEEVTWFYEHASSIKPKVIVEIGIKEGGNLKILSTLVPRDGLVVGIDPRKDIPWVVDNETNGEVLHICGDSHSAHTIQMLEDVLGGRYIDILFIDGDHSYDGMLQDFYDYHKFVRSGGIIAVHDIYYLEDVTMAWADVPGDVRFESKRINSSIGIGFVKKEGEYDKPAQLERVNENPCSLSRLNERRS